MIEIRKIYPVLTQRRETAAYIAAFYQDKAATLETKS